MLADMLPANDSKVFLAPLRMRYRTAFLCLVVLVLASSVCLQASAAPFRKPLHVVALAERGGLHQAFVDAAKVWLARESHRDGFTVEYLENTNGIDDRLLAHCDLFLQLNYPPYNWTTVAKAAFTRYIDEGRGGWIGFHHAALVGNFDGFSVWPWYQDFIGGITFTSYIPTFATGTVHVVDRKHPIMQSVPVTFTIKDEEWYTWDRSPQSHMLAKVDERSYTPDSQIKMGDHPVIWTNPEKKAHNVYFFMGHHPDLFLNPAFTTMFHNAILWATAK